MDKILSKGIFIQYCNDFQLRMLSSYFQSPQIRHSKSSRICLLNVNLCSSKRKFLKTTLGTAWLVRRTRSEKHSLFTLGRQQSWKWYSSLRQEVEGMWTLWRSKPRLIVSQDSGKATASCIFSFDRVLGAAPEMRLAASICCSITAASALSYGRNRTKFMARDEGNDRGEKVKACTLLTGMICENGGQQSRKAC